MVVVVVVVIVEVIIVVVKEIMCQAEETATAAVNAFIKNILTTTTNSKHSINIKMQNQAKGQVKHKQVLRR